MEIKNFIQKLQSLSDKQKKIVLWTIVVILGLVMGLFWIKSTMNRLSDIGKDIGQIEFPQLENPLAEIPEIQISSDQTDNWETYTNNEFSFEIKYPKDAFFQEVSTSSAIDIYVESQTNIMQLRISPWVNDEQYKSIDELISSEREKQMQGKFSVFSTIPKNYTKTNLSGVSAVEWDIYHETAGKIGTTAIILRDGYYYGITARADPLDGGYLSGFTEANEKVFRDIISTFKFIE